MTETSIWHVYIVRCKDDTLYTGIAKHLDARIEEHNSSPKGAKYTRGRRPVEMVYSSEHKSRSDALKEEHRIKQLSRVQKNELI